MRPLFAAWYEVAPRLAAHRLIALFLDFDGTLTQIQPRPETASVHPAARRALAALARNPRFRVWVISGRRRSDIQSRLRVPGIGYLGLYGWERGVCLPSPERAILQVKAALGKALPAHRSLWLEDKQYTVTVHYRNVPLAVRRRAKERVERAVAPWGEHLRVAPGKCVWEILPRALADKGVAVRRELAMLPVRALPVYVGDDCSDEPAFAVVSHGLAIRAGTGRVTRARYSLDGVRDVRGFLERLEGELP